MKLYKSPSKIPEEAAQGKKNKLKDHSNNVVEKLALEIQEIIFVIT